MSSEADDESIDLFQEPADFYEPEKEASFASHTLLSGEEIRVRLVGHNPLWVSYFVPLCEFEDYGDSYTVSFCLHPSFVLELF